MSAHRIRSAVLAALLAVTPTLAHAASEQQSLEELRNTVINLLQTLVDQGVMTREKAAQLVKQAQDKAAVDAAKNAKTDEGAVRVPYVPQVVKDDIATQVAEQVKPAVVEDVVKQAKSEGWGVPGALPEWLERTTVYGDVRVRAQADLYSKDNAVNQILDYQAINTGGGLNKTIANNTAFLNTTEDRERLRVRARLGIESAISSDWHAGVRLATGAATDPSSESQTLGTTGERYNVGFDLAYIRYEPHDANGFSKLTGAGGRFINPWFSPTELVYARDLTFDGVTATGRYALGTAQGPDASHLFLTAGASPIQDVPLASGQSKWLLGVQLGALLHPTTDDRVTFAGAYYDFLHMAGRANNPTYFTNYNYTAPQFVRHGNTMFAITTISATDTSPALYALAADFHVADLAVKYEHSFSRYVLAVNGEAVRNVAYHSGEIYDRTGINQGSRNKGYVLEVGYGDPVLDRWGSWHGSLAYRYVQGDAVLDAWTDADFHEGGTNATGYILTGDLGVAPRTYLRLRYLSANEIDLQRYGVDIVQLDLNTRF